MRKPAHLLYITVFFWICFLTFETPLLTGEAFPSDHYDMETRVAWDVPSSTGRAQNLYPELEAEGLTPAQQYAGEILSYLLPVVLGQAGRMKSRKDWRMRGIDEKLDFKNIVDVMTNHERNQLDLMVLDMNILDLTRTLYYYDEELSLYRGDYNVASLYPAPEFIAVRLLLLQKIYRSEKIGFKALMEREALLQYPDLEPSSEDLRAMNLDRDELELIREIVKNKPHVYQYLKSPFLVKAFSDVGAIAGGDFAGYGVGDADYKRYPCRPFEGSDRPGAVKVLFLPSMTMNFYYGDPSLGLSRHGFKPTEFFDAMSEKLAGEILSATKTRLKREISRVSNHNPGNSVSQWDSLCDQIAEENLSFYIEDERPLVIYPGNAEQVIRDVCPESDFTVILLGKNIYKSIFFDETRDVYPFADRVYVDIMDIKHSDTEGEIEKISEFICSRLKKRIGLDSIEGLQAPKF